MFGMIIGSSNRRNIQRMAESMPSELNSNPLVNVTTIMREKDIEDECKRQAKERQKYHR